MSATLMSIFFNQYTAIGLEPNKGNMRISRGKLVEKINKKAILLSP
ncbi:hypothetical protein ykris0001_23810 [Yersinia kristensenii ATCC 33638]|nr:hypothetical protein ykris0001_23810 [Yersinia kristensenii ATCC 33638]